MTLTDSEFLDDRDCTLPSPKPCPFCGNRKARLIRSDEWLEDYGIDDDEINPWNWAVVCDAATGKSGCGACGGFAMSEAQAVAKWNRRTEL